MEETIETLLARIDTRQQAMFLTMQDVLAEQKKTNGRLRAVEGDVILLKTLPKRIEDLEPKVTSLEGSRFWLKGAWYAVFIIGAVIGYFLRG